MALQISISTELACTLITTGGIIFSALISKAVAKSTAAKEIEKMKLTWEREDLIESDDEFGEMVKLVILYLSDIGYGPYEALAAIGALRVKESTEIAALLDVLYQSVKKRDSAATDKLLDEVIAVRRKSRNQ